VFDISLVFEITFIRLLALNMVMRCIDAVHRCWAYFPYYMWVVVPSLIRRAYSCISDNRREMTAQLNRGRAGRLVGYTEFLRGY
jgi:hypothetical protein